ncbi:MAG: CHAT domain-containing protein [Microcoleus sp. PH2017_10_PVI_O_A]|uniref:CHAT domain-containing protein n=1 Tax=unclassified Microcoleus TaxID=2642155 RepID=UPI001D9427F7|nr:MULTISPECIES: CHAT domain-containing protein [unclassified Microcoleus]TAE77264.1 MAG: CHAT domain-containing protein [Oscillatoriales cyanobacterium]MCC3409114.1 CHAT domain-containing protein [Microcoleus sp. PH2017_10_PVI_O_A]MCC3463250.1 CHAT domain-containing protein [Microcoleus sp. PH2017_11_PCY_U_A]MCC3481671.1 CHAT domain-containing protein [Microcoleus sp. PH2017_12_PCY_D_A]MCC3531601.1 CHAT domain-containing protein [Microcoleus sp. PH2017_21_RUC_O_A]
MNTKKWKISLIIAATTAFLCSLQIPITAQIPRTPKTNTQLTAAQNLQSAGLYRQACNSLLPVLELTNFNCQTLIDNQLSPTEKATLEKLPNTEISASGLRTLGDVLRVTGALKTSEIMLNRSLAIAQNLQLKQAVSAAYLSLGNLQRAIAKRQEDIRKNAKLNYAQALKFYERAIALSAQTEQLQAKLNKLSLLVETQPDSDIGNLWQEIKPTVDNLPPTTESIYARIDFAESLICLKVQTRDLDIDKILLPLPPAVKHCTFPTKTKTAANPELIYIAKLLASAAKDATKLGNLQAESYAKGSLGELYEITGQLSDAKQLTTEALGIAQSIQAADIGYRWQWQLGRLTVKSKGETKSAIAAYQTSVQTLQSLRKDLIAVNPDVQFSFRDNAEPVYRELVDLLVTTEGNSQPNQANLEQAIQQIDALQLAEIENFLRCNLSPTIAINKIPDKQAALIYPIILEDKIAIIFQVPGKPLTYRETRVPRKTVETTLQQLRNNLSERGYNLEVIADAKKVYQWLIEPLKPELDKNPQIETLVFVQDGDLRNIPMAVLYDEKSDKYLVEDKYAIAISPQLTLFAPQPLQQKLKVFVGGIGQPQNIDGKNFEVIQKIKEELEGISKKIPASQPLLEANFTKTNIQNQLQTGNFSAVHLKTHGEFSSDPDETYIVAYQKRLKGQDIASLIETGTQERSTNIELLVLSACQTASGDNRAVLGLAGIAVRAGARSTLSTLWEARDAPNTELMVQFYEELSKPGMTRAKALHLAQKSLFERHQAANIWATYILVGNWL